MSNQKEKFMVQGKEVMIYPCERARGGYQIVYRENEQDDWKPCYCERKDKQGYWRVYLGNSYDARYCRKKPVYLHRLVYSYFYELPLGLFGEHVHHIDHDKSNNSLDNLVLLPDSVRTQVHHYESAGQEEEAKRILSKYIIIAKNRLKKIDKE